MTHSLTLGSLLLTGDAAFPDDEHGFWFEVAADGTDFGTPEAVTRIVTSLMLDGAIVSYDSDGNRTIPVRVRVHGPTLNAVAHGEAALRRESKKNNLLTWQPPDDLAPPSVYETYPSPMLRDYDGDWDLTELRSRERTMRLSLACGPFARGAEMVTVEAVESGTTSVLIDDCASATGWTGKRNGVATTGEGPSTFFEAGAVGIMELSNTVDFPPERWTLTRAGTVDFTSTRYLSVELTTLSAKGGAPFNVEAYAIKSTGAVLRLPLQMVTRIADGSGYFRAVYDGVDAGSVASLVFEHTSIAGYGHTWQGLSVRDVKRTDVSPSLTARQQTRIIETGGTERTPASIHVSDPENSAALGLTIVHTSPEDGSGYSPPLRRWRVSGNTVDTPRPDALSGSLEPINPNQVIHRVPAESLPTGGYLLMARLATTATSTVPIYWSVGTIVSDGGTAQEVVVNRTVWNFTATEWNLVPLGVVTLPTVRTQKGWVEVVIHRDPTSIMHVVMDDAWLFRIDDDCALTYLNDPWPNVWLESPDVTTRVPTVYMGPSREVRFHPGAYLKDMGTHVLHPEGTAVFTATEKVDHPKTAATFYRRWPYNAAD